MIFCVDSLTNCLKFYCFFFLPEYAFVAQWWWWWCWQPAKGTFNSMFICQHIYWRHICMHILSVCVYWSNQLFSHLQAFEISNSMALNSLIMVDKNYLDNKWLTTSIATIDIHSPSPKTKTKTKTETATETNSNRQKWV